MGGDPEVVVTDHLAFLFQAAANRSVGFGRTLRQGERGQEVDEFAQALKYRRSLRAFLSAKD